MNEPLPAFAVIDGALCELGPFGRRTQLLAPLATAVAEFRRGPLCTYVREVPFGMLPGLANLYCLDGAGRLQWMAEWPDPADPCAAIVNERADAGVLVAKSASGAEVRISTGDGKLLAWVPAALATAI